MKSKKRKKPTKKTMHRLSLWPLIATYFGTIFIVAMLMFTLGCGSADEADSSPITTGGPLPPPPPPATIYIFSQDTNPLFLSGSATDAYLAGTLQPGEKGTYTASGIITFINDPATGTVETAGPLGASYLVPQYYDMRFIGGSKLAANVMYIRNANSGDLIWRAGFAGDGGAIHNNSTVPWKIYFGPWDFHTWWGDNSGSRSYTFVKSVSQYTQTVMLDTWRSRGYYEYGTARGPVEVFPQVFGGERIQVTQLHSQGVWTCNIPSAGGAIEPQNPLTGQPGSGTVYASYPNQQSWWNISYSSAFTGTEKYCSIGIYLPGKKTYYPVPAGGTFNVPAGYNGALAAFVVIHPTHTAPVGQLFFNFERQ